MKITIESTERLIEISNGNGSVPARLWEGKTDAGVPVIAFITGISPRIPLNDPRQQDFQAFQELDPLEFLRYVRKSRGIPDPPEEGK